MGYNRENFNRIKQEYDEKYANARRAASERLFEIHTKIPEVARIDRILGETGAKIMSIICSGEADAKAKIEKLRAENTALVEARKELLVLSGYSADYTDVKYECEKCGDSGYVDTKMCECMKKKLVYAGYESSGMSRLLMDQNFDNFSLDYYKKDAETYNNMCRVYNVMKDFADGFSTGNGENLALFGGTGLGKTHLSSAVAGRVIERGYDVVYTTAIDLISDFENHRFGTGMNAEHGDTERYSNCELLIIDDLGTEVINQFTVSCIYNVINTRLNKRLSTILSTNLTPSEFRQKYWDRITSRVLGEYKPLLFKGNDIRQHKLMK